MNDPNPLPLISSADCSPVPVFSCHVILSKPDENGRIQGRTANLPGISAAGSSERDVLTAVMKKFKAAVQEMSESGKNITFRDPPEQPADGEVERFIPVHL